MGGNSPVKMEFGALLVLVYLVMPATFAEDVSYQACVDKYSRKGYQPWQEWSDHYTCHRYRCEIRDGKYFIAAVGCRKPKIPENALECHEYIEDENVEFPTCCARLRCVVEANGERIVQTRGQPGELFPDKPWKGQQNEPNPAVMGMVQQNTVNGEPQAPQPAPAIFNSRGAADSSDINGRRITITTASKKKSRRRRSPPINPLFNWELTRNNNGYEPQTHDFSGPEISDDSSPILTNIQSYFMDKK
ncbi:unnamed protein product [Plutella xylostella]|uniref:(diamondback moth) hypothetical protein n=1 Tax=Plutella xylostella TaxID=51655 RepID=A0A8S4FZA0_PLUXY|nr:uncharacterized protein LOC105382316 isoform X2 [Plutella xylostella]CAG9134193.1 unnamed protein product [Plutella xylostella]